MIPVEKAIHEFASTVYRETMGVGRVVEVTIDGATYDRVVASMQGRGMRVYTASASGDEHALLLTSATGVVRVKRGR